MNKNNETPTITKELLKEWRACKEGYEGFNNLFPDGTDLETAMQGLDEDGHSDWSFWLFLQCLDNEIYQKITLKGYRNSGDRNSGDRNSGSWNSGDWNSGSCNLGNRNSGNRNSGDRNSGNWNSGNRNSGDWNSGNWNSGDRNSGDRNSGDRNSGSWNSGDWNSGDWNSGFLNSVTPENIMVFNKPCLRKDWDIANKPEFLFFDISYWVDESEMTDQEKIKDPNFHVIGGQLRTKNYKNAIQESWGNASKADRDLIQELPNFDADVFYEISGIDVSDRT